MKRSEAIKLIEEILHGAYDYPAIAIIHKLEAHGVMNVWESEHGEKKHENDNTHGITRKRQKHNIFDPL